MGGLQRQQLVWKAQLNLSLQICIALSGILNNTWHIQVLSDFQQEKKKNQSALHTFENLLLVSFPGQRLQFLGVSIALVHLAVTATYSDVEKRLLPVIYLFHQVFTAFDNEKKNGWEGAIL